jgi:hypothetical protein
MAGSLFLGDREVLPAREALTDHGDAPVGRIIGRVIKEKWPMDHPCPWTQSP